MRIFANHQKKRKKNGMNLINNRISRHCAGIVCMFVSAPWRLVFGSTLGSAVSVKRYNLHFKAFSLSNGHEYGESRKNAIRGKIKGVSRQKIICTLTT